MNSPGFINVGFINVMLSGHFFKEVLSQINFQKQKK